MLVHLRHLQFVFEVSAGAQTLDDGCHPAGPDKVDHQPLAGLHPQIGQMRRRLLDHRDSLVDVEHALLGGVDQDRHHHLVKLARGPFEDIVAGGHDR